MNSIEQTITTVEIAEMLETVHYDVLKKLEGANDRKGIIEIMTDNQMSVSDFFIQSTYTDNSGKANKCYNVTKMGCDFLANKFTGEKGILFTAKYVKRFREMETHMATGLMDQLSPELQAIFVHDKKLQAITEHMEKTKHRVDNLEDNMTINSAQRKSLKDLQSHVAASTLGGYRSTAYKDEKLRKKVFRTIWRDYNNHFEITTYSDTPTAKINEGKDYLEQWQPDTNLRLEIQETNRVVQV